jgi:hypothetical protein
MALRFSSGRRTGQPQHRRIDFLESRIRQIRLQRQELLERDAENSYLAAGAVDEGPMDQLLGRSITYRMAIGLQRGCKVFTLQTLPESDPYEPFADTVGKAGRFSPCPCRRVY